MTARRKKNPPSRRECPGRGIVVKLSKSKICSSFEKTYAEVYFFFPPPHLRAITEKYLMFKNTLMNNAPIRHRQPIFHQTSGMYRSRSHTLEIRISCHQSSNRPCISCNSWTADRDNPCSKHIHPYCKNLGNLPQNRRIQTRRGFVRPYPFRAV